MAIDQLDLKSLRAFVAVAEELHFGRAADRLHIAQPSLSVTIRRLETQLGVTLLERTSRSVALTPAGETLLRSGRRLLTHADRVLAETRASPSSRLTVGFYGSAAIDIVPRAVATFRRSHPEVEIVLRELALGHPGLAGDRSIDVAFTRLVPEQAGVGLAIEVLAREPRVVALPAAHPLAGRASLRYRELLRERFVVNPAVRGEPPARFLAEQRRHGLPGRIAAEVSSVEELLTCVAAGQGVGLLAASAAEHFPRPGVSYVAVEDAEPAVVSILWRRGAAPPHLEDLLAAARAACGRPVALVGGQAAGF